MANHFRTRQRTEFIDEHEANALNKRLIRFDEAGVAFPKAWCFTDSRDQLPEDWQEFHPASWVELGSCMVKNLIEQGNVDGLLACPVGLHDLTIDLERMLAINPALWNAFVQSGGQCAFYKGKEAYNAGGVCHDHRSISYRINADLTYRQEVHFPETLGQNLYYPYSKGPTAFILKMSWPMRLAMRWTRKKTNCSDRKKRRGDWDYLCLPPSSKRPSCWNYKPIVRILLASIF